jgi:dihydroorotate dehydrogenase (NAD+) catalytic subunit
LASDAIASRLCGRNISSPVLLSSGILGVSIRTLMRALDSGAGAVVTKSIGLEPREGFVNPTVVQVDSGLLNAVGLANPGARAFAEELSSVKGKRLPIMV